MKWLLLLFIIPCWLAIAIYFRNYAQSVVHNYILQKEIKNWCSRLWQRNPKPIAGYFQRTYTAGWDLVPLPEHKALVHYMGFIAYREVSTLQFWLVAIFLYGPNDCDANQDTTDVNEVQKVIDGNFPWYDIPKWIAKPFVKPVTTAFGNTFTLGDVRSTLSYFQLANWFVWFCRNPFRNYLYLWKNY